MCKNYIQNVSEVTCILKDLAKDCKIFQVSVNEAVLSRDIFLKTCNFSQMVLAFLPCAGSIS
jgi:hypothetical protein